MERSNEDKQRQQGGDWTVAGGYWAAPQFVDMEEVADLEAWKHAEEKRLGMTVQEYFESREPEWNTLSKERQDELNAQHVDDPSWEFHRKEEPVDPETPKFKLYGSREYKREVKEQSDTESWPLYPRTSERLTKEAITEFFASKALERSYVANRSRTHELRDGRLVKRKKKSK